MPITDEEKRILEFKLDMIDKNLRNCNSGADIHEVGNMRNVIQLLRELLENCAKTVNENLVRSKTKELEEQQLAFFRKKYHAEWPKASFQPFKNTPDKDVTKR